MGKKAQRLRNGGRGEDAKVWRRGISSSKQDNVDLQFLRNIVDSQGRRVGGIGLRDGVGGIAPGVSSVEIGCNLTTASVPWDQWPTVRVPSADMLKDFDCPGAAPATVFALSATSEQVECLRQATVDCAPPASASLLLGLAGGVLGLCCCCFMLGQLAPRSRRDDYAQVPEADTPSP